MNHYPLWKYMLIGAVIALCTLYALPNLFGEDPAVQISPAYARNEKVDVNLQNTVEAELKNLGIADYRIERDIQRVLVRLDNTEIQLKVYSHLKDTLKNYVVAQNLAPATPAWLRALGAEPMYLGLDLRGGVHFLMQVDMDTAVKQDEERLVAELRSLFRENKIRYKGVARSLGQGGLDLKFAKESYREAALKKITTDYPVLQVLPVDGVDGNLFGLHLAFTEQALKENAEQALEQNITTLRNRVNELGVAEPVIQRQGIDRIVVQLPGVQDTARAKEILGATATLEFRLVADEGASKYNSRSYKRRNGSSVLLKREVIVTGNQINDAAAGFDQTSGQPMASVRLNSQGAKRMFKTTGENIGKPMAVVFIEHKIETKIVNGKEVKHKRKTEEVINTATIQGQFGSRFQITGLTSPEASNLALLLRAGALKAPMEIVEERTIGPSLGQENIDLGMLSIFIGFMLVMFFMWLRYGQFGLVANFALLMNVVILIALLSLLQATLTLPGMAGIVLTLGMAVDANVLIFERIREEIHMKNTPQASIHAGFEKAFSTIADANITTLIAAVILFSFGTGPIKGFAITLSLGIVTSMFTAIMVSRGVINYRFGGRKLTHLPI